MEWKGSTHNAAKLCDEELDRWRYILLSNNLVTVCNLQWMSHALSHPGSWHNDDFSEYSTISGLSGSYWHYGQTNQIPMRELSGGLPTPTRTSAFHFLAETQVTAFQDDQSIALPSLSRLQ